MKYKKFYQDGSVCFYDTDFDNKNIHNALMKEVVSKGKDTIFHFYYDKNGHYAKLIINNTDNSYIKSAYTIGNDYYYDKDGNLK